MVDVVSEKPKPFTASQLSLCPMAFAEAYRTGGHHPSGARMISHAGIHLPETPVVKRQIRTLKRCADKERQRQVTGGKKNTGEQRAD